MIYKNVEFFNTEQVIEGLVTDCVVLNRFSRKAVQGLDHGEGKRGPITQAYGSGIEVRFVSKNSSVDVYMGAWDNDGYVGISLGDYDHSVVYLPKGEITRIALEKNPRLQYLENAGDERFSKKVWRIKYLKRFTPVFSHIDGKGGSIRPPAEDEVPKKTLLAYGSSITFGAGTGPMSDLTHMDIAARMLGVDLMNKSMPGTCFCEVAYGDYLSDVKADFYYYELGGNMRLRYTPEEFKIRASHIVKETRRKNPKAPVILLTVYPWLKKLPGENSEKAADVIVQYDKILTELSKEDEKIHLVNSEEIINDARLLSFDVLHPSGYGNMIMAQRIKDIIFNIIQDS